MPAAPARPSLKASGYQTAPAEAGLRGRFVSEDPFTGRHLLARGLSILII
jgi:hypothetical protein